MSLTKCCTFKRIAAVIIGALLSWGVLLVSCADAWAAEDIPRESSSELSPEEAESRFPILWELSKGDFEVSTDGVAIGALRPSGFLEIILDASSLEEKDYYTAHFYKNGPVDLSEYGEVYFLLQNLSDEPLKLSAVVVDSEYTEYRVTDNMPILVRREGVHFMELIGAEWGAAEIPPGFRGVVHIPGYNVSDEASADIISVGLSFTLPKGSVHRFRVSDMRMVPIEYSSPVYGFEVIGEREIQAPIIGEAVARYAVQFRDVYAGSEIYSGRRRAWDGSNSVAAFGIDGQHKGVSITRDGILTITEEFKDYYFRLYADIDGQIRDYFTISVFDHWSKDSEVGEGILEHLPRPEEVPGLKRPYNPLFDKMTLYLLRAACLLLVALVGGLYIFWGKIPGGDTGEEK